MTKLEQLINEFCPNGVEYKRLEKVVSYMDGAAHEKILGAQGEYIVTKVKFISSDGQYKKYCDVRLSPVEKDDVIMVMSDLPNGKSLAKCFLIDKNNTYTINQRVCSLTADPQLLLPRFLYYILNRNEQLLKYDNGYSQTHLKKKWILDVQIPIPPIVLQSKIVRILDKFTELTVELNDKLTAELTTRRKQYEYYRDSLLTFGDDVPMVKLGDIATDIYRGAGIKRDEVTADGIPCVRYGEIYTAYDISFTECVSHTKEDVVTTPKYFEHGDIIFTITGESVEEIAKSIAYLGYEKCMAGGDTVVMKHTQEPRYISYALSTTDAQTQKSKGKVKSKVVHSSVPALKDIEIPLPNIETQKRIADLLDNFHKLYTDIFTSLPAEIEARQKQYEYYRDKLLTFKEKKN